jgi:hypothetical protein
MIPEQALNPIIFGHPVAHYLRISPRHLTDVRKEDCTFSAPRLLGTVPRCAPPG